MLSETPSAAGPAADSEQLIGDGGADITSKWVAASVQEMLPAAGPSGSPGETGAAAAVLLETTVVGGSGD